MRRIPWWWTSVAALLVLGAGAGGVYYVLFAPPPPLKTAEVTKPVQRKPELLGSLWLGPTHRGGGDEGEDAPLDPESFKMGVQLVNLQVSLEANQGEQARDVVARELIILKDQMFVDELKQGYTGITTAIVNGTPPEKLTGKASELAEQAREAFDAPHVDLGQWVEAGRLAAIAEEPSYFRRGDTRALLRRLLWRQKFGLGDMKLDPVALQSLRDISEVLEKKDLESSDYARLRQSLEAILDVYYPQS